MREFTYQSSLSIMIRFTRICSCTDQSFQTEQISMVSGIVHSKDQLCFLPWYQVSDIWFQLLPLGLGCSPLQNKFFSAKFWPGLRKHYSLWLTCLPWVGCSRSDGYPWSKSAGCWSGTACRFSGGYKAHRPSLCVAVERCRLRRRRRRCRRAGALRWSPLIHLLQWPPLPATATNGDI